MVREIVHLQMGQCGNYIGNLFWKTLKNEHKLDFDGKFQSNLDKHHPELDKINVYFEEAATMKFVPRACIIDLEPTTIDIIKAAPTGKLFNPDNMCFGASGCGLDATAWSKGHYTKGAELIDEAVDILRREMEICEYPQGIQLTHSIASGTGGGMGSLMLLKIRDTYPGRIISTYSVFPSPKVSDVVVEAYHATLTINHLLENSDQTYIFDNDALFNINCNILQQKEPKYAHLNWIVANAMSGITAPFRFKCELNPNMRTLGMNLIPFPKLHFFLVSIAPLFNENEAQKVQELDTGTINDELWSSSNWLSTTNDERVNVITSSLYFRGELMKNECDFYLREYQRHVDHTMVLYPYLRNIKIYQHVPPSIINLCGKYFPSDFPVYVDKWKCCKYEDCVRTIYTFKDKPYGDKAIMPNWIDSGIVSGTIDIALFANDITNCIKSSGTMVANTAAINSVFENITTQFYKLYIRKAFLNNEEEMEEMEFQESDKNIRDLILRYQDGAQCGLCYKEEHESTLGWSCYCSDCEGYQDETDQDEDEHEDGCDCYMCEEDEEDDF